MRNKKQFTWMLLVPLILTTIVYMATSNRAVIDYDEGHYSQVAKQMLLRNDWITPYDNGVRFLEKPPLMYWITALSFRFFGISEFALRLPTVLAVVALVWIVTWMAARAAGQLSGVIAGVCTAFSVGTYLFTREALHDVWLVLFLTLAIYAFWEWHGNPQKSLPFSLLFYAAAAGAVMTKSLVGIAFSAGIVFVFFLLRKERPRWRALHIVPGIGLFLLLVIPWHLMAALRNHDFVWSFFLNEQVLRFFGKHDPPIPWSISLPIFWLLIPVWFFPWTAFLPAAVVTCQKSSEREEASLMHLCLASLIVILGFYSVSGRLEHYAFPVLPPLSLAVGVALSQTGQRKSVTWGFRTLAIVSATLLLAGFVLFVWLSAAGFPFAGDAGARTSVVAETDFSILEDMPGHLQRQLLPPAAVTLCVLAVAFGTALLFEHRRKRLAAVFSITAGMVVVCAMVQWSLVICEDLISSKKFAHSLSAQARPGDRLVVFGDFESANSMTFYQPLHMEICGGVAYSLIPGMKYPDAPHIVLAPAEFESLWKGRERVFALMPKTRLPGIVPRGVQVLEVADRVLIRNH
jgi:4-amino-4-deoxy-L-arabinose transferase-like glycosyltransferase